MFINIINELRKINGKEPIFVWDYMENNHCLDHCHYLAWNDKFEYTPAHFLRYRKETIARCEYRISEEVTFNHLINNCVDKNVILNSDKLSYGFYVYQFKAYLVLRGW